MRLVRFAGLIMPAVVGVATVVAASDNAASGPARLTLSQMGAVTAGGVSVSSSSSSSASGDVTSTYTSTQTLTISFGAGGSHVDIGRGRAEALACCGTNTYAGVSLNSSADGALIVKDTHITDRRTEHGAFSQGWNFTVSVQPSVW